MQLKRGSRIQTFKDFCKCHLTNSVLILFGTACICKAFEWKEASIGVICVNSKCSWHYILSCFASPFSALYPLKRLVFISLIFSVSHVTFSMLPILSPDAADDLSERWQDSQAGGHEIVREGVRLIRWEEALRCRTRVFISVPALSLPRAPFFFLLSRPKCAFPRDKQPHLGEHLMWKTSSVR